MLSNLKDFSRAFWTANFIELSKRGANYFAEIAFISAISLIIYGKVIAKIDAKKA